MADITTDVGLGRPGTSVKQDHSGVSEFEETRENGTHKVTKVSPDGEVHRTIERTDPSTGIHTRIERHPDGHVERIIESPGGQIQATVTFPDGHKEGYRSFKGPDGSDWNQSYDREGRLRTTHDSVDPDGTQRHVVKTPEGNVEITTTKVTVQEDGSKMTQVKSPNGDIQTRVERLDGTSETSTMHPDGTDELVSVFREEDGTMVTRHVAANGAEAVDRQWTTPDGHEHRVVKDFDGTVKNYENWEDVHEDGTRVMHHNGPLAQETTTTHPNGSYETIKNNSDGTIARFTHTENPDGSVDNFHMRSDGKTSQSHYEQNEDGSVTTHTVDYNGLDRTTMVGRDGRVEVNVTHPDGSHTNTSYSADGSGRIDYLDENGHPDGYTDIQADPAPVPHDYANPEEFIGPALRELPPMNATPMETDVAPGSTAFGAVPLTEDQQNFLDQQGVELPEPAAIGQVEPAGGTAADPAAEAVGGPEIGAAHKVNLYHGDAGGTTLIETLPDGTRKLISVEPDGKVYNTLERANPSTGIETTVSRNPAGDITTTVDSPGGARQVTIQRADGSEEVHRMFMDSDGSQWGQTFNKDGVRTMHQTFDPDGTLRTVEKLPDGTVEVNTTKTMMLPDGTGITEVHAANGDVSMMTTRADGTSHMRLVHPDGTEANTAIMTDANGVKIITESAENGAMTTTKEWTDQGGSLNRTVEHPDGHVDEFRTYDYKQADGSTVHVEESPTGIETTTKWENGNVVKETQDPDGNTNRYSYTKNPDGSAVEREELWTGPTRETHFGSQNLDGSYTTVARGFDNVETRTTLDENGRLNVRKLNPDGTSTESDFNPDGSGHTTTFDANGNPTGDMPIAPVPAAVPRDFNPDRFESDAENHLPPDTRFATDPMAEPEIEQHTLSDAQLEELSARGIVGPDTAAALDDATDLEPVGMGAGDIDLGFPPGSLGDVDVRNWGGPNEITKEPIAFDNVHGKEGTYGFEQDGETYMGEPVDMPEENIILPDPDADGPVAWPGEEEIVGMEPMEEHDPIGPDPDARPLEESTDTYEPTPEPEPEPEPDPDSFEPF